MLLITIFLLYLIIKTEIIRARNSTNINDITETWLFPGKIQNSGIKDIKLGEVKLYYWELFYTFTNVILCCVLLFYYNYNYL